MNAFIYLVIMKIQLTHTFEDIISIENLLNAWKEFIKGKRGKRDVQEFQLRLMDNIFSLHRDLATRSYRHGAYEAFSIFDSKPRRIHKASVRDRLLHHAVYRILYPFFDRTFIADSFSCRLGKGTHKALNRFRSFAYAVGKNNTKTCWALKCDIRKFFTNIDHIVLFKIIKKYVSNAGTLRLIEEVVGSFSSIRPSVGLPLGNLTSQLLVNIYMNEFDQFVKHKLKAKHYIRYADDFVILSQDRKWLESSVPLIRDFLGIQLKLELHPDKLFMKTLASGVDFLGWVHFPDHRVLRTTTKKRMMRRLAQGNKEETWGSYLGMLSHGNAQELTKDILKMEALRKW